MREERREEEERGVDYAAACCLSCAVLSCAVDKEYAVRSL